MARHKRSYAGEHLEAQITVQLMPSERTELEWAATRQGASLSAYVRELCLRRSAAVVAATPRNPEVKALLRELSAIGNNLNQIAREINTDGDVHDPARLRDALADHKRAIARALDL